MQKLQKLAPTMILSILYVASLVLTALWMVGFFQENQASYTRFAPSQVSTDNQLTVESPEITENNIKKTKAYIHEYQKKQETKSSLPSAKRSDIAYDLIALEAAINLHQYPTVKVVATGYTAGYESTGKKPDHPQYGITFSGVQVRRDLYSTIAADPKLFPLGTVLYIPNYGYGVVADIGSAIQGNKIDLYYHTVDDVYSLWGKQEVDVYLIKKGNGKVTEEMLNQLNQNQAQQVFKQR